MSKWFDGLTGRRRRNRIAGLLYARAVEQARRPWLFKAARVPDSLDGRFDMIALHVFLVLHRLQSIDRDGARELGQALFDLMFEDMDQSLREMGVGDLGVGRRVKDMAKAFYGRIAAYQTALAAENPDELDEALRRNVYRGVEPGGDAVTVLAGYVRRQAQALSSADSGQLLEGHPSFVAPPGDG